jgi:hypothetical protein
MSAFPWKRTSLRAQATSASGQERKSAAVRGADSGVFDIGPSARFVSATVCWIQSLPIVHQPRLRTHRAPSPVSLATAARTAGSKRSLRCSVKRAGHCQHSFELLTVSIADNHHLLPNLRKATLQTRWNSIDCATLHGHVAWCEPTWPSKKPDKLISLHNGPVAAGSPAKSPPTMEAAS